MQVQLARSLTELSGRNYQSKKTIPAWVSLDSLLFRCLGTGFQPTALRAASEVSHEHEAHQPAVRVSGTGQRGCEHPMQPQSSAHHSEHRQTSSTAVTRQLLSCAARRQPANTLLQREVPVLLFKQNTPGSHQWHCQQSSTEQAAHLGAASKRRVPLP